MDARYTIRRAQLLEECQVAPEVFEQVMPRLRAFMAPFVDTLQGQAPRAHAQTYVRGLLSDVERKNVESLAYHFGQDRLGLQGFIGWDDGDDAPVRHTLQTWPRHPCHQWGLKTTGRARVPEPGFGRSDVPLFAMMYYIL